MRAILTYHSIDDSGSAISVSPQIFREHAEFLSSGRVKVVPLARICSEPEEEEAVALTFDDGFRNVDEHAMPELCDRGLAATIFAVTERVGRDNAWDDRPSPEIPTMALMDWDALGRARDAGIEIGAHTRRHRALTLLSGAVLEDEIVGSAQRLQAELGVAGESFAYPYGVSSEPSIDIVRRTFRRAVTTELRAIDATDDAVLLPRLDMYYFRTPGALASWGTPAFRRQVWLRAQGRRARGVIRRVGGGV
jgi:peptidoglycan/xylan/chitin deacetylase (PgdA/CDA1 family)